MRSLLPALLLLGSLSLLACNSTTSGAGGTGGDKTQVGCVSWQDCQTGDVCVFPQPLPPLCGGTCIAVDPWAPDECEADANCQDAGAGFICDTVCVCPYAVPLTSTPKRCYAGCSADADCGDGLSCDANHHCSPRTCAKNEDCAEGYACFSGLCGRASCSSDADCPAYCIGSTCRPSPGECRLHAN